jgi:hypothetical protein
MPRLGISGATPPLPPMRDSVSKPILGNIYVTKFESIIRYGIIFWDGVNDSNAVFIIQKKNS